MRQLNQHFKTSDLFNELTSGHFFFTLMQISEKTECDFAQLKHLIDTTDTEDGAAWSQQRIWLAQLVRSQSFETLMGLVILVNVVLLG